MRSSARPILLAAAVLVAAAAGTSTPSQAAGCGGYVNVFVSGCAPWDNNPRRMPGAPGYQPPRQISQPGISPGARPGIVGNPNARPGVIAGGGAGLISPGNRTGSSLISPGNRTGSSLIGNDSAGLISPGNRTGSSFRR
jgi:hypothetical protein